MSEQKPFTYDYLRELLARAKEIAPITTLKGRIDGNCIILRHDVDYDIYPAHRLSGIEEELDVVSTFFIMTSSPTYNPGSGQNRKYLREMAEKGFEMGLHFDPTVYGDIAHDEMEMRVKEECRILENIIGQPIESISLHNPSVTGQFPIFRGFNNAYAPEIFSDDYYLSDSCMGFRGKDPMEFVERASSNPVQMVFHPLHWSETGSGYAALLSDSIKRHVEITDKIFQVNPTYKEDLGDRRLLDEIK